jgi:ankyrin repeat protein
MRKYIRYIVYLVVFTGFSYSTAGSYDDFFVAVRQDNALAVRALLGRGFDPNTPNPQGQHALLLALKYPSLKVAEVLVSDFKTTVEVRNASDESPLMLAALAGLTDLCKQMIDRDADVNKPGWTPLHYAATGGSISTIRLLLDNHAYIDAASPNGSTPLMMAAMYGTDIAVKQLLDSGADATLKNDLGLSAVDFATRAQKPVSVAVIAAALRAKLPAGAW